MLTHYQPCAMEVAVSYETLIPNYQITRRHIPENLNLTNFIYGLTALSLSTGRRKVWIGKASGFSMEMPVLNLGRGTNYSDWGFS
jgi:hypothetical protein